MEIPLHNEVRSGRSRDCTLHNLVRLRHAYSNNVGATICGGDDASEKLATKGEEQFAKDHGFEVCLRPPSDLKGSFKGCKAPHYPYTRTCKPRGSGQNGTGLLYLL